MTDADRIDALEKKYAKHEKAISNLLNLRLDPAISKTSYMEITIQALQKLTSELHLDIQEIKRTIAQKEVNDL